MESFDNYITALGFGFIENYLKDNLSIEINFINGQIEIKGFGKSDLGKNDFYKLINSNESGTIFGIAKFQNGKTKRFSAKYSYFSRFTFPDQEGFYSFIINPIWLILNKAVSDIDEIFVKKVHFSFDSLTGWTNVFHKKFDVFGEKNPFNRDEIEKILIYRCEHYSLSLRFGLTEKILERNRRKIEVEFEPFFIVEFVEQKNINDFLTMFKELCDLLSVLFNEKTYLTELYITKLDLNDKEPLELLNNDILISKYLERESVSPRSGISYEYFIKDSNQILAEWNSLHPDIKNIMSVSHIEFCKKQHNLEESFTTFCSCIESFESILSYLPQRAMDIKKSIGKKGRGEPSIFYFKLIAILPPKEILNIIFKGLSETDLSERLLSIMHTRDYFHHRNKSAQRILLGRDLYIAYMQLKAITAYHLYTCLKIEEKEKSLVIQRSLAFLR